MRYLKKLNEMSDIIKKGKNLTINNNPLKNIQLEEISDNIIYWRNDKNSYIFSEGFTMVWFIKDDISIKTLKADNNHLLFFSRKVMGNSPISDIWLKNKPQQKGIIGILEAFTNEDLIYIDMMSVRPGYMKNGINKFMIEILIEQFPNAILKFSLPTKEGKLFIKKYYPNAKIENEISKEDIDDILNKLKNKQSILLYTTIDLRKIIRNLIPSKTYEVFNMKRDELVKTLNDYINEN